MDTTEQFQKILLRLYTHAPTLQAYIQNKESVAVQYSLTDAQRKALFGIPTEALQEFQQQLFRKKLGVVSKVLQKGTKVVAIPFSQSGSALLLWNSKRNTYPLTDGMYLLLEILNNHSQLLTLQNVISAYTETDDERVHLWDVFKITKMIYTQNLNNISVRSL